MTPKVSSSCVCFNRRFRTICGFTSFLSSMTIRMPSRFDSSRRSVIPSTRLSRTKSAIFSMSLALLTRYGSSETTMRCFPFCIGSILVTARTRIFPLPVRYASSTPLFPSIVAPVGKSGPWTRAITSSSAVSRSAILLSMIQSTAPTISRRLCGGILVAIPTAMPCAPLTNKFGKRLGSTTGSCSVSSKFGTKSTVSLLMSAIISIAIWESLASVYRIAAAPSPSMDPKFPCPSTRQFRMAHSCAILTRAP